MRSDLIILRYKTEEVIGTKTTLEPKTYFGSKMIDVEDEIFLNNGEIQYSEVVNVNNTIGVNNNGYQYIINNPLEKTTLIQLNDLKNKYCKIDLVAQSKIDLNTNTQWKITINWIDLLTDYLYYKLKEKRTFKCIRYTDVISENINYFIRDYITTNILNRYAISNIEFFIKYLPLDSGDEETTQPNLLFDPKFDENINNELYYIKNLNSTVTPTDIVINYKQTQDSKNYKFDYYYNLTLKKI